MAVHRTVPGGPAASSRWRAIPRELVLVLSGIGVYFGVRGITASNADVALDHAGDLVRFEQGLGFYWEPELQEVVTGSKALMTFMNWVYIWGHWPVITVTLFWLFLRHADGYRIVRNTMLLSGGVGLFVFATFPVAPPRLVNLGLVDTVTEYSHAYRVLQPPAFVNQYAAMPSLHVGWDLLVGIAIFTYASHVLVRAVGVLLPMLMTASVVLTANHYIIDAVIGSALVLVSLFVVRRYTRPSRAGAEPEEGRADVPEQPREPRAEVTEVPRAPRAEVTEVPGPRDAFPDDCRIGETRR